MQNYNINFYHEDICKCRNGIYMTYVQIVYCIINYNSMIATPNSSMVYQPAPPPLCSYATVSDWRIQCSNLDERTTD